MLCAGSSCKYAKSYFWSITFLCLVCFDHADFPFIQNNSYENLHFVHFYRICIRNVTFPVSFMFIAKSIIQNTPDIKHCSQTFLINLFLRFAGVSYGRFIAIRFEFDLSTYVQNRW